MKINYIYKESICETEINGVIYRAYFSTVLNNLCKKYCRDLNTTKTITKSMLNIERKVPLFIDSTMILIQIRSEKLENSLYVNYKEISSYSPIDKDMIHIKFKDGSTKIINISYEKLSKYIVLCELLDKYSTIVE